MFVEEMLGLMEVETQYSSDHLTEI